MRLIDEEEVEKQKIKTQKTKRMIIITIVLLLLLCSGIIALIAYRMANPTQITTYIDGVKVNDFDKILDFSTDENGKTEIYVPIRDFATYLNAVNAEFGYQTFKGDYSPKTEEDNKCYVYREGYEVAMYTKKSKTIYKLNLQDKSDEYEECITNKDIFENNGKLYTSVEGIEKGYNVAFSYDEKKKVITIYTLDYMTQIHSQALAKKTIDNYGKLEVSDKYADCKSIFEDLLIVKAENGKYGIVRADDYTSFVLEPQYDNINYVVDSATFLVESNKKIGLFTKDGKRKIDLVYDKITSMGQDSKLYVVETNGMSGVVDENGKIIIYPQYDKVGTDVASFSYNGIKNGYILLNTLIPVEQDGMWAFFDKTGKKVSNGFKYKDIGCSSVKRANNVYPLLEIPEYNVIVVSDEDGNFAFMDTTGNDSILNFLFDEMYIKVSEGEPSYWMTFRGKEYEILKYLRQSIDTDNTSTNQKNENTTSNNSRQSISTDNTSAKK